MRLILPMAYVFFIVFEKDSQVNSQLSTTNDNLTYRLMALKPVADMEDEDEDETKDDSEPAVNASPATHNYSRYIKPRRKNPKLPVENDSNSDSDEPAYVKRQPRNNYQRPSKIPDDFEEEISQFQIAAGVPKTINKPKKYKHKHSSQSGEKAKLKKPKKTRRTRPKSEESNNNETQEEEEEETEEKKEKIHKITIKKKRPHKNETKISNIKTEPYRTIIEGQKSSGSKASPHRLKYPSLVNTRLKPLTLKENVALNPILYHDKKVQKNVNQRDVNFILQSSHRTPKILIRRYKPIFSIAGYPLITTKKRRPIIAFKKGHKYKKKQRRKRKKVPNPNAESYFPYAPLSASHSSCGSGHPNTHHSFSYPSFDSADQSIYPSYQNLDHVRGKFSTIDESSNAVDDSDHSPYQYQENPSESISHIQLTTVEPQGDKTEDVIIEAEPNIHGGYDVHEHENTEELAALHKQETDDSIEAEEEADPIRDDEAEHSDNGDQNEENEAEIANLEYETEENETDPDFVFGFNADVNGRKRNKNRN